MHYEESVKEFHVKHGFAVDTKLKDETDSHMDRELEYIEEKLEILCRTMKAPALAGLALGDKRVYRIYLMSEELQEIVTALKLRDEVELADGCGDLQYVLSGTAVTYDIPLKELFDEIHKSNMTKKVRCAKTNSRMRDKGASYVAPDIKRILGEAK